MDVCALFVAFCTALKLGLPQGGAQGDDKPGDDIRAHSCSEVLLCWFVEAECRCQLSWHALEFVGNVSGMHHTGCDWVLCRSKLPSWVTMHSCLPWATQELKALNIQILKPCEIWSFGWRTSKCVQQQQGGLHAGITLQSGCSATTG
jgi:hypothetical protein